MGTVMNSQGQPTQSIVIGTPGYMPSEQSIGRPVYGSDLYSLGLTAIYLLTGKQPSDLPTDPNSAEILWRTKRLKSAPLLPRSSIKRLAIITAIAILPLLNSSWLSRVHLRPVRSAPPPIAMYQPMWLPQTMGLQCLLSPHQLMLILVKTNL